MIGKAVHVAETTGVKVCQIFPFLLLYISGLDKETAFFQGGAYSIVAWLSHMTIDHASLARREGGVLSP